MNPSKVVELLLPDLESGDSFARLDAERRLLAATRRDFGFRWNSPDGDRARAVARVRAWVEARRRTEGGRPGPARRARAHAAALEAAEAHGLDPKEVEKKIQELFAKAPALAGIALGRPACQGCARRPATVEIVEVSDRRARTVTRLCEPCAAKAGGPG